MSIHENRSPGESTALVFRPRFGLAAGVVRLVGEVGCGLRGDCEGDGVHRVALSARQDAFSGLAG